MRENAWRLTWLRYIPVYILKDLLYTLSLTFASYHPSSCPDGLPEAPSPTTALKGSCAVYRQYPMVIIRFTSECTE